MLRLYQDMGNTLVAIHFIRVEKLFLSKLRGSEIFARVIQIASSLGLGMCI